MRELRAWLTIWKCFSLKAKLPYFLSFIQSIVDLAVGTNEYPFPLYIALVASEVRCVASCVVFSILQRLAFVLIETIFITIYTVA